MMRQNIRFLVLTMILSLLLVGCAGGAFGSFLPEEAAVDSTTVVREMRYYEQGEFGDRYEVTFTVPEGWVGSFETVQTPTTVTFNFVDDRGRSAPIFSVYALSLNQFWEQNGSYPGVYSNIGNTYDTYFMYHASPFAFYSGLDEATYEAFTAMVPDIVASFMVEDVEEGIRMTFSPDGELIIVES